jgi:hypothetical protein
MDAGGNNFGAVNALRQNKDLPDGWLSEEYVRLRARFLRIGGFG